MTPLKVAIVITMILMIISLIVAGIFLAKDKNKPRSKRTLYALGMRVSCAIVLILLGSYGVMTGELRNQAPWAYVDAGDSSVTPTATQTNTNPTN